MNYATQKFFFEVQQLFTDLNKGIDFAIVFAIFLGCYISFKMIIKRIILFIEKKKSEKLKALSAYLILTKSFFIFFLSIFISTHFIALTPIITAFFIKLTELSFIIQFGIWLNYFIKNWIERGVKKKSKTNPTIKNALSLFRLAGNVIVWGIVILMLLDSLEFKISGLLAGLGIGGIAIGLASQKILADLFASVSIILDNPFAVGDKINFGDFSGRVEYIGLKTTHLRSKSGELIVCSNADLIATRIKNFQRVTDLRTDQQLTIAADTPYEVLIEIPQLLKKIIDEVPLAVFKDSCFSNYAQGSLIFTVVYIIPHAHIDDEARIKESINYKIYALFQEKKINFAYPTQRLLLEGGLRTIKDQLQDTELPQDKGLIPETIKPATS
ncbi:MAG: mechanosensitive ion channel [Alphaproteobacteria bacterium]|nr:mechanosensitive ion channel [Alphaproteobacteria bacterium]